MARLPSKLLDVIGTIARLGLAAVWLVSGAVKAADANQTVAAVKAYDVLPAGLVGPVAGVLPFLELAFGLLVLLGIGQRLMGVLSAVLLLVYIAGVAQSWARGLTIDCGCFGGGGQVAAGQTQYPQEILRDIGFLVLAAWLVVRPRSLLSVDGLLRRGHQDTPDEAEHAGTDDTGSRPAVGRA
ncbi:MAG TPA: MauE/DoxX family redox-associated membrane protein [Pseudonocardiaceae bacterium]|nr:MauE/DoxX family redox-associated membrane protein [Pseudonocardiaceae bacterium]